ncbi:hypothetical protein CQA67_33410, partial [Klebsiella pneumoniae]
QVQIARSAPPTAKLGEMQFWPEWVAPDWRGYGSQARQVQIARSAPPTAKLGEMQFWPEWVAPDWRGYG